MARLPRLPRNPSISTVRASLLERATRPHRLKSKEQAHKWLAYRARYIELVEWDLATRNQKVMR